MTSMLDGIVANGQPIRIAECLELDAFSIWGSSPNYDGFIGLNYDKITEGGYFTEAGEWTRFITEVVIAHEFAHQFYGFLDPQGSEQTQNTANFNHKGAAVTFENVVAQQLGYEDYQRSSYLSSGELANFESGEITPTMKR